jgi:hypothetical protein
MPRRKLSSTRGKYSRITSLRLPYPLEAALKAHARDLGIPWQTALKQILSEALGLIEYPAHEVHTVSADNLHEALKRFKS